MTTNLIQYAPGFVAIGCKLDLVSNSTQLRIAEFPKAKGIKSLVEAAIKEIEVYEDTSNFSDGISVLALADFVDNSPNPLPERFRLNVLNSLGIMKGDKYIAQVLARDKVNRSWHISEIANDCSHFGELCTHRGMIDDPHRRGRKAVREPKEYHRKSYRGITREQLVTPKLQELYEAIPVELLVSQRQQYILPTAAQLQGMEKDDLARLLANVKEIIGDS